MTQAFSSLKYFGAWLFQDIGSRQLQYPLPCRVTGDDQTFLIHRQHAVRHAFQHRFIVVFDILDVVKQFGVFQRHRDLAGKGAQALFVLGGESPAPLVQTLGDTDDLSLFRDHWDTEDRAGVNSQSAYQNPG